MIPIDLEMKLETIDSVATLPNIAVETLEMMRNKKAAISDIALLIEKDPSITLKILKVANSPLWGYSGRVENIQKALVLLGLKQVTNIVIAISLYSTFAELKPNPHFNRTQFWEHAVGTAHTARKLARAISVSFQGEEFVAGLIHDLGKMVLDQYAPEEFKKIVETAEITGQTMLSVELQTLGCSHAEVGAMLLQNWKFPISIVESVKNHHQPEKAVVAQKLTAVIALADMLCQKAGIGNDADGNVEFLAETEAYKIVKLAYPSFDTLDIEIFISEIQSELSGNKDISALLA